MVRTYAGVGSGHGANGAAQGWESSVYRTRGFTIGTGVLPASEAARRMQAQQLCLCQARMQVAGSSPRTC